MRSMSRNWGYLCKMRIENHLHGRKEGGGRQPSPAAQEEAGTEPSAGRGEYGARMFGVSVQPGGSGAVSGQAQVFQVGARGSRLRCNSKGRYRGRGICRHRHRWRNRYRGRGVGSKKLLLQSYFFTARTPCHPLCNFFCLLRCYALLILREV